MFIQADVGIEIVQLRQTIERTLVRQISRIVHLQRR